LACVIKDTSEQTGFSHWVVEYKESNDTFRVPMYKRWGGDFKTRLAEGYDNGWDKVTSNSILGRARCIKRKKKSEILKEYRSFEELLADNFELFV